MSSSSISGPGNPRKPIGTEGPAAPSQNVGISSSRPGSIEHPKAISHTTSPEKITTEPDPDPSKPSLSAPLVITSTELVKDLTSAKKKLDNPPLSPEQILATRVNTDTQQVVSIIGDMQKIQSNNKLNPLEKTMQLMILMTKLNKIMSTLDADILKNQFKEQVKADHKALEADAARKSAERKAASADLGTKILGWCSAIGNLILAAFTLAASGVATAVTAGTMTPAVAGACVYLASAIAGLGMQIASEACPEDAAAIGIAMTAVTLAGALIGTAITMGAGSAALVKEVEAITEITEKVVTAAKTSQEVVSKATVAADSLIKQGGRAAEIGEALKQAADSSQKSMDFAKKAADAARAGEKIEHVREYAEASKAALAEAAKSLKDAQTIAKQAQSSGELLVNVSGAIDETVTTVGKASQMSALAEAAFKQYAASPLFLKVSEIMHFIHRGQAAIEIPVAASKTGTEIVKAESEKEIAGSEATKIESEQTTQNIQFVSENLSEAIQNLQRAINQLLKILSGQIKSDTETLSAMLGKLKA